MRAALIQITASDDPAGNLPGTLAMIRQAAAKGAELILTPEVTNCVSGSRARQNEVLQLEADDISLAAFRTEASALKRWLLIGSLGVKTGDPDGRFANRSFLIGPDGQIAARYDKIHMFDVELGAGESYRESIGYRPGEQAVVAEMPMARIGMTICYDIRFSYLYRALAQAGAQILTIPAAFSQVTGAAHWETLLRARAIETGCFVLAPAQTGVHPTTTRARRATWGHSMAIAPWGEVLADAGKQPGVTLVDLDLARVVEARSRVPSLQHDRTFRGP